VAKRLRDRAERQAREAGDSLVTVEQLEAAQDFLNTGVVA
jgi:hypothetical protein